MSIHLPAIPTPREAYFRVTGDLIQAVQLLKVEVLDHVVVGETGSSSMKALGLFY